MVEVYSLKITGRLDSVIFNSLMQYLDENKQAAIRRFYKWEDSQRALFSELLIRTIAMEKLRIDNGKIQFEKNEYGKPFLKGFPEFCFNLSHSGEWVVCAIDDEAVGIDVEEINHIDLKISDRFFSEEESADIRSKPASEQLQYFFDIWTLKESYIKAWGKGLSVPLDSFSLKVYPGGGIVLKTGNAFRQCFFHQYDIDPKYKMSVCSLKNKFPDNIREKSLEDIIENKLQN